MIRLYSAVVCPFAQRPRALLAHLGVPYEEIEIDLRDRPEDFLSMTPTGKVPLLVEDDLLLYESRYLMEYLAEAHDWNEALSDDVRLRARQRLGMARWDEVVVPAWYSALEEGGIPAERADSIRGELEQLERTVESTPRASLPGLCCATHWLRMRLLADHSPLPEWVDEERPRLAEWLDGAVELDAIRDTSPDEDRLRRDYLRHYVSDPAGAPA